MAAAARPASPMATTPSHGWSRSRPTSVPMSSIASRALAATEFSVRENTTFGIGPLDPGVARKRAMRPRRIRCTPCLILLKTSPYKTFDDDPAVGGELLTGDA